MLSELASAVKQKRGEISVPKLEWMRTEVGPSGNIFYQHFRVGDPPGGDASNALIKAGAPLELVVPLFAEMLGQSIIA